MRTLNSTAPEPRSSFVTALFLSAGTKGSLSCQVVSLLFGSRNPTIRCVWSRSGASSRIATPSCQVDRSSVTSGRAGNASVTARGDVQVGSASTPQPTSNKPAAATTAIGNVARCALRRSIMLLGQVLEGVSQVGRQYKDSFL